MGTENPIRSRRTDVSHSTC